MTDVDDSAGTVDDMTKEHQVTHDKLRQMRERLDAYERRYGLPSDGILEAPQFRDEAGQLIETDDLMAWSSLWDRYELLTAPPARWLADGWHGDSDDLITLVSHLS